MPLRIVNLSDGSVTEFKPAPQRTITGNICGGGWSVVIGWLGAGRIYYHERFSTTKEDGLTVGDLASGARRVFPFFDVQHLRNAGDGFLIFSTWVELEEGGRTSLLFLLDTATGDTWPLFAGTAAAVPGVEVVSETSGFGGV